MRIIVRQATREDLTAVLAVESEATPNLRYLPMVSDQFFYDEEGDFSVAEADGEVVGCAKFTVMPDGSAWLEALRVMPKVQGNGIGKAFYARFFEVARKKGIKTMRMYTGVRNKVSKGLAERNGFSLAGTYRGMSRAVGAALWSGDGSRGSSVDAASADGAAGAVSIADTSKESSGVAAATDREVSFRTVIDPERATRLLMPLEDRWGGFVVMNRTFYRLTPALCETWTKEGKVFEEPLSGSVVALGARFMPEQALHLAAFSGDERLCLEFAAKQAELRGVSRVQCMFPPSACDIQSTLVAHSFEQDASDYLVMEVSVTVAGRCGG